MGCTGIRYSKISTKVKSTIECKRKVLLNASAKVLFTLLLHYANTPTWELIGTVTWVYTNTRMWELNRYGRTGPDGPDGPDGHTLNLLEYRNQEKAGYRRN